MCLGSSGLKVGWVVSAVNIVSGLQCTVSNERTGGGWSCSRGPRFPGSGPLSVKQVGDLFERMKVEKKT